MFNIFNLFKIRGLGFGVWGLGQGTWGFRCPDVGGSVVTGEFLIYDFTAMQVVPIAGPNGMVNSGWIYWYPSGGLE